MDIKIGQKYRIFYGNNHPANRTIHIRAIVDEHQIVFRWYGRHKRWWHYQIEHIYFFELGFENKTIKEV